MEHSLDIFFINSACGGLRLARNLSSILVICPRMKQEEPYFNSDHTSFRKMAKGNKNYSIKHGRGGPPVELEENEMELS